MTVELFRSDPYRYEFVAQVVRRNDRYVTLDQTCFAPRSRQIPASDQGWLGSDEVLDVRLDDRGAPALGLLACDDPTAVPLGVALVGRVDWARRLHTMRLHTACHLVELGLRATHDVTCVGPDASEGAGLSVVVARGVVDIDAVREWTAALVAQDLPMVVSHQPADALPWVWHLDGYGHHPCDGLHVASTAEIGGITLCCRSAPGGAVEVRVEVAAPPSICP